MKWERSTKEVVFIVCEKCCLRLEAEIDRYGTAMNRLDWAWRHHWFISHKMYLEPSVIREVKERARTELIDLDMLIDLRDIISKRQMLIRARKLAKKSNLKFSSAVRILRRRINGLVLMADNKYVCRSCQRYITPRMAERYGLGRSCAAHLHAKDKAQRLSGPGSS